jgi:hypothetical protein
MILPLEELRERLIAFYLRFNPEKIGGVDQIVHYYGAKQDILNMSLKKEYGCDLGTILQQTPPTVDTNDVTPPAQDVLVAQEEFRRAALFQEEEASAELLARLVGFYSAYNPAKIGNVDQVVQYYLGDEGTLNENLHKEYSVDLTSLRLSTLAERLTMFYSKHNPSKLQLGIDSVVAWYEDKVESLNTALRNEYEDDLESQWILQWVPPDYQVAAPRKIKLLHKWYEHKDLHNRLFYYNAETGECMQEKPLDFDGVTGEDIPQALKVRTRGTQNMYQKKMMQSTAFRLL